MIKSALLGRDISYTRSPSVHAEIARALGKEMSFDVVDVPFEQLGGAVKNLLGNYDCFYITKPYKTDIKGYLSELKTRVGVNFVMTRGAVGYNTDGMGFISARDRRFYGWRKDVNAVLVLGAGGAAYAVTEALIEAGKKVYVLNRTLINAAKLCKALGAELYLNQPAEMIVNCTSAGLHGEDVLSQLCILPQFDYAYDLIYSPEVTPFLHRMKGVGAKTANGSDMLVFQAIEGDKIAFGVTTDTQEIFSAVADKLDKIFG